MCNLACVNQPQLSSWNKPAPSNEGRIKSFSVETTGAFDGVPNLITD